MAATILLVIIFISGTLAQYSQYFLPWENIIVPDDVLDDEDRRMNFVCYAQCFAMSPASALDMTKKQTAQLQPNCYRKTTGMSLYRIGTTKIYISQSSFSTWMNAYVTCRKYSMDLLGQGLTTLEDELVKKLSRFFSDRDMFWLGANEYLDGKFHFTDTANDIPTTGRFAKIGPNTAGSPRCLEARVNGSDVSLVGSLCMEQKKFICVMQKHCIK